MYLFAAQDKKPAYYRLINGNIPDVSSMSLCVKEIGVQNVVFIADKGFYRAANVQALDNAGLHSIIPLHRNNALIDYEPLDAADFKKRAKFFVHQKRIIWCYEYEREGKHFATYLDERLRVEEEADYLQRVTTHPDTTTMVGYYERLGRFGTVTLVWKTGVEHSAQEVYEAYKQRNEIEVLFDRYKNFIAGDTLYMKDRYVLEGWLLANFIAMLAYYKLYNRLREAKLLRKHSPKDILEMSRAIYQMKIQGRWTCSEVPQRVRILFASLGLGYLN